MRPRRETMRSNDYAYFVSTQTDGRKPFFRHERWARLMLATLDHYDGTGYQLHAYVVMPDHLHLLLTPFESVEKSVQLIKGGFSFRAKRELEWNGEIWQPGFTDHRIRDEEDWQHHLEYIRQNPIQARLVEDTVLYPYMNFPRRDFPQGLKPIDNDGLDVRAEARTLQAKARTLQASADEDFPQGLKPIDNDGLDVRAEARPLQAKARTPQASADEGFPQGLKPIDNDGLDVRAEARTLQAKARTLQASADEDFPQGLKPIDNDGLDVRAKARQKIYAPMEYDTHKRKPWMRKATRNQPGKRRGKIASRTHGRRFSSISGCQTRTVLEA